jgi:hypothetical protein
VNHALKENINMEIKPGFTSLFDGKDLKGWIGDPNFWKAENGIIVGRATKQLDRNLFLWTEKEYSNFIFYSEVRLIGHNSGIQFRSVVDKDGHMAGYQADIGDGCWGALYEELLRGHLVNFKPELIKQILHVNEWNEYMIIAIDDYIIQILNGVVTVELYDPEGAKKGIFGLQIHGGPPQEASFRNLCIKEL